MMGKTEEARDTLFKESTDLDGTPINGYDFSTGFNVEEFFNSFAATGLQASNLGDAINLFKDMQTAREDGLTLFLSYTSNMVSSGVRELIRFLVQEELVDVLITTGGGVEEDIIKTEQGFYRGRFDADDKELRKQGINRIGNIYAPNDGYIFLEDVMQDLLGELHTEQKQGTVHTPSEITHRLGQNVGDEDAIAYWAAENNIPMYCPTLTDGAIGDQIFLYRQEHGDFQLDMAADVEHLGMEAVTADNTGLIILGGGAAKHHACNAAMLGGGAIHALYINTHNAFDGSNAGAPPSEAVSWGKIDGESQQAVKVHCDASIAFPLILAGAFHA